MPPLIGKTRDEAVRDLTALNLEVSVVEVNSEQEPGIVTAQDPAAGTVLITGSTVRVNVSKGIKQVAVPSVVGQQVDIASSQLQLAGFKVGRIDVESEQPAGEVVTQSPPGNSTAAKRILRDAVRLEGPHDGRGARRDPPAACRRAHDVDRRRVQGARDPRGHR